MRALIASVLALGVGVLAAISWAMPKDPIIKHPCSPTWTAIVCADEAGETHVWSEQVNVASKPSDLNGTPKGLAASKLFLVAQNDTLDFQMTVATNSIKNITAAGLVDGTKLPADLSMATFDSVKAALVWGHGCQNASDTAVHLSTVGGGVWVLGTFISEQGDTAVISAAVTHHTAAGHPITLTTCGPQHFGKITAAGQNAQVGSFTVNVVPQQGGTLSNFHADTELLDAEGTLTVSPVTQGSHAVVHFSGAPTCKSGTTVVD